MYKTVDTKRNNIFSLTRKGWWQPCYTLTNGAENFGRMCYKGISRRTAIVKTATDEWHFYTPVLFSRNIIITDANGVEVGRASRIWFSRRISLSLQTGFHAEFNIPSIFSRKYVWTADGCGRIMEINSTFFGWEDSVTVNNNLAPQTVIPLLIFLGKYLSILRRRRRAAH
ncbi:MAG TPA: hypothetical protein VHA56_09605 [Mucilaginibacter sp.]|nr:hypothetical protein [Mucilaginibacter sp.]